MARVADRRSHTCTYCLKYPLHGVHRVKLKTNLGEPDAVCCKTCRNERLSRGLDHERFLVFKLRKYEKLAREFRIHVLVELGDMPKDTTT